jgi:hypothetical protein
MIKTEIQNSNITKYKIDPKLKIQNFVILGFWIYLGGLEFLTEYEKKKF